MSSPNQPTQQECLYDALAHDFPGLFDETGGSVFQFAASPTAAGWRSSNDSEAYNIANQVPMNLGGYYEPSSGMLDDQYKQLLSALASPNALNNREYQQISTQLAALSDSLNQETLKAQSAYQVWTANNPGPAGTQQVTFSTWLGMLGGGAGYQANLANLQSQITSAQQTQGNILKSLDGPRSQALLAAGTDTMFISSNGGTPTAVPRVTIGGDISADLVRWTSSSEPEYAWTFDKDYVVTYPWKTVVTETRTSDCYRTETTVQVDTSRIVTDEHFKMHVTMIGLQTYAISRGEWYESDFVTPAVEIAPGGEVTNDTFFGLRGSLHLIPSLVLVSYGLSVGFTVSTDTYTQQFASNATSDVGWLELFGNRYAITDASSLQPVDHGDGTTTVTFAHPEQSVPQVLGVVSQVEYNGRSTADAHAALAAAPVG